MKKQNIIAFKSFIFYFYLFAYVKITLVHIYINIINLMIQNL